MKQMQVGVIGAGQMGAGIAQCIAQHKMHVHLVDSQESALKNAQNKIRDSLQKFVDKKFLTNEDLQHSLQCLHYSTQLESVQPCLIVIEAISENEKLKASLFQQLDKIMQVDAILASNTSSISITKLASYTKRESQVIGMHFMNPVPLMKLVELILGLHTSQETLNTVRALAHTMQKTTTHSKDFAGFIANRILMPMINEAFFALMEGLAKAEDIDLTLKLGANHPMGPLALADFIGLDTCLAIMEVLHKELGDGKYRPCPLLRQYVQAGLLGKKSGRGVYVYGA